MNAVAYKRRPRWLKISLQRGGNFSDIRQLVRDRHLHTVCQSAHCPNIGECWSRRTATFMILGETCTRNCRFCAVSFGKPKTVDPDEPRRVAKAVADLGLEYAVITSVTRDDLPDGGARIFAATIQEIRKHVPKCSVEVLIPDLKGDREAVRTVINAAPDVLNHNLETVSRLYSSVRPQANYRRSLGVLEFAAQSGLVTKSGLMVGVGETRTEIEHTIRDLVRVNCQILTVGQYLQPSLNHLPIHRFVVPDEFEVLRKMGLALGLKHVEAGPLVRSSYHADTQAQTIFS